MKLNHDCVRELLLYLEEHLELKGNGMPDYIKLDYIVDEGNLSSFPEEDVYYSASKLVEAGFISVASKTSAPRALMIGSITWKGHDYLDSIRDSKVWIAVKEKTKGLSGVAFEIMKSIAVEVTKQTLGLK